MDSSASVRVVSSGCGVVVAEYLVAPLVAPPAVASECGVGAIEYFVVVNPPIAPPASSDFNSKVEEELLKVVSVDQKIIENAKAHHTDRYELTQARSDPEPIEPSLVVRRGEPFDIVIRFHRSFNKDKDDIQLIFEIGDDTRESRGTRVVLLLSDEDEPKKWGAKIVTEEGETFTIRIFTPPHVAVGKWKFSFDTMITMDGKREVYRYQNSYPVYILFNPWCADDSVFLSDESSRNEYVLNDRGRLFYGSLPNVASMPWNFGQFEDFVTDLSLLLLDMSKLKFCFRGNAINVVRKISAMLNAQDDNGVLAGNWTKDFSGGTPPLAWNGSVAILEEYWKTREPVRYGQCWVFSALVTTICRALGIPCRSVTNFESAHDTDGNLTIDDYRDIEGKHLEGICNDSAWNFHVWNEVWMTRPDLPDGYGGWQAIDATPQEASDIDGVYCTGPCSVEAIKQGLVELPYDGPFLFAEVNADRVYVIQTSENGWQHVFNKNAKPIGNYISTKGPDGNMRHDITNMYKFPEGSQEEKTAMFRATSTCSSSSKIHNKLYDVTAKDIDFSLAQKEEVLIGKPFDVILKLRNNSGQQRTVKVTLSATVIQYTGVPVAPLKSASKTVALRPNAEVEVKMTVDVKDYVDKVTDMCHVKMSSMSQVVETKQFHCDSDDFRFSKPTLNIKVPAQMQVGKEYEIVASFTNPLQKTLAKCEWSFEAPSLKRPIKLSHADVSPQGAARCSTKLTPMKEGETEVIVGFWSKELSDITGSAKVKVVKV